MKINKNIISNFFGQSWAVLVNIFCLPLIIRYLGPEAYGLVGAFTTLMAWLAVADLGMCTTLNREISRTLAGLRSAQSTANLLRTVEIIFGLMVVIIFCTLWQTSNWLATHWFSSEKLSTAVVVGVIQIIAFVAPLQCIESLYRGAFLGLQRHDVLNVVRVFIATLRWAGAVAVLASWSADIQIFFLWQAFVSLLSIGLHIALTYRYLPQAPSNSKFSIIELKVIYLFSGGMFIQTILTLLLTQTDKVILSKMLSLEAFGYYMMAVTFAGVVNQLINPITSAYFPRFSELVALKKINSLIETYHQSSQLVSALTMPITMLLIIYGSSILLIIGIDSKIVNQVAPLLSLVAIGLMLNGLMHIPYMLTLAFGWTSYAIVTNVVALIFLFPAIIWGVPLYGAQGAAGILIILNIGYLLISMKYLHSRLLKTELWNWYRDDLFKPLTVNLVFGVLMSVAQPHELKGILQIMWIFAFTFILFTLTLLSCNRLRGGFIKLLILIFNKINGIYRN